MVSRLWSPIQTLTADGSVGAPVMIPPASVVMKQWAAEMTYLLATSVPPQYVDPCLSPILTNQGYLLIYRKYFRSILKI